MALMQAEGSRVVETVGTANGLTLRAERLGQ